MLADIDQTALDAAVEQLQADGAEAHGVICDVTKLDAVEHLADESFRLLGEVNLVFNNAGIAYAGPIADVTHGDWRWVIDVDLWGPIHGVEAFLPAWSSRAGIATSCSPRRSRAWSAMPGSVPTASPSSVSSHSPRACRAN